MMYPLRQIVFTFMILTSLLAHSALAQVSITVTGTVTDRSGGVLAGATVRASADGRLVSTMTEPDGRYRLDLPSEGGYRLTVRRDGFTTQTVEVMVASGVSRDFQLAIARLEDSVVVTASRTPERHRPLWRDCPSYRRSADVALSPCPWCSACLSLRTLGIGLR